MQCIYKIDLLLIVHYYLWCNIK